MSVPKVKIIVCDGCGCQYSYEPRFLSTPACPECGLLHAGRWGIKRVVKGIAAKETKQFVVSCMACGARHGLDSKFRGQRIKCRACGVMFDTDREPVAPNSPLQ